MLTAALITAVAFTAACGGANLPLAPETPAGLSSTAEGGTVSPRTQMPNPLLQIPFSTPTGATPTKTRRSAQ